MAKINVSVSSSSSKPNVTVSKGPVGPQGEQGVQGEAGPQGVAGTISSVNDIPEFDLDLDVNNLNATLLPTGSSVSSRSSRYLVWDPSVNKVVLNEDGAGQNSSYVFTAASGSPRPSGQFVTGNVASTEGGSLDGINTGNGVVSVNHSGQIDNSLNLYVNGDTRVNGVIQVGTDSTTAYSLPSADGTANQILKTDGGGAVSFTGDYLTKSTADVITATKRFNVQQDFLGGVNITNGASINGYTLPASDGTAGQFLKTDGSGNISFAAASSLELGTTSTTALAGDTTTISTTQASEIAANTLKVGITTTQASEITANTAKVGITTTQANAITANTAKTDTHLGNSNLTAALDIEYDQDGYDLVFDPNGGTFEINDSSGLPDAAEIAIGQGNVDIAGTQVSINGIDYPAVDGSAGQFLKTDGSGNLSFSNVAQSIDGLTDVDTTTTAPSDSSVLAWDATNSHWEPRASSSEGNTSYVVYATARTNSNGTTDVINGMTISRSATGTYNYTFDTALPDSNYVVTTTPVGFPNSDANIYVDDFSTTGFIVYATTGDNGGTNDPLIDKEHCLTVFSSQTSGGGFIMRGDDGDQGPIGS